MVRASCSLHVSSSKRVLGSKRHNRIQIPQCRYWRGHMSNIIPSMDLYQSCWVQLVDTLFKIDDNYRSIHSTHFCRPVEYVSVLFEWLTIFYGSVHTILWHRNGSWSVGVGLLLPRTSYGATWGWVRERPCLRTICFGSPPLNSGNHNSNKTNNNNRDCNRKDQNEWTNGQKERKRKKREFFIVEWATEQNKLIACWIYLKRRLVAVYWMLLLLLLLLWRAATGQRPKKTARNIFSRLWRRPLPLPIDPL